MLFNHLDKSKQSQRGSIMLEVIAVLALMGVMGAMLFRQIYQRNQELHNIQMASEMRTIKEAFSAYIQAERAELITKCGLSPTTDPQPCMTPETDSDHLAGNTTRGIRSYLPSGWFSNNDLQNYYTFSLWIYKQNDITEKTILYGVIVPKSETIPQTGWNFKRAARVALLIGADGGVYNKDIDSNNVNGALGTWQIDVRSASDRTKLGLPDSYPTYVAMTGMDIFTPEYELPEGNVTFEEKLDLGMRDAQAWQYFAAGGNQGCYTIKHTIATDVGGSSRVQNDDIKHAPSGCTPLFFVDQTANGGTGKVFVNHDLEIGKFNGADPKANVTIRQEGPIAFNASVADPQNSNANTGYLLDPQYTSVMNDVKIMSRGGAKLSEILPKYILQTQTSISSSSHSISVPTCPKSYKAALAIFPVSWDQSGSGGGSNSGDIVFSNTGNSPNNTMAKFPVAAATTTADLSKLKGEIDVSGEAQSDVNVDFSNTGTSPNNTMAKFPVAAATTTADLSKLKGMVNITPGICVKISKDTTTTSGLNETGVNPTGSWNVILAHVNDDTSCGSTFATDIKAIAQAYCVWDSAIGGTPTRKTSMGADWTAFAAKINTISDKTAAAAECRSYGGTWNGTVCN